MGIKAQTDLQSFHEFLTQKLQSQNTDLTPEQAVAQWRERQATIASVQRGLNDLDAERVNPADEVLDRLKRAAPR